MSCPAMRVPQPSCLTQIFTCPTRLDSNLLVLISFTSARLVVLHTIFVRPYYEGTTIATFPGPLSSSGQPASHKMSSALQKLIARFDVISDWRRRKHTKMPSAAGGTVKDSQLVRRRRRRKWRRKTDHRCPQDIHERHLNMGQSDGRLVCKCGAIYNTG